MSQDNTPEPPDDEPDNTRASSGHYETLVDRTYMIADMWSKYVLETLATKQDPKVLAAANKISESMWDFYQLVGATLDEIAAHSEKNPQGSFPRVPERTTGMSPEVVLLVADLAKRWMPGTRHGSDRPSWMHPGDVAEVVKKVPGIRKTLTTQATMEAVAWGHDLLEDGVTESGEKVTEDVLRAAGVPEEIVVCIKLLSKEAWMTKPWYARQVMGAPNVVRIVKCADRIANLTEAKGTFSEKRWAKYVAETEEWILPMAEDIGGAAGKWLAGQLSELVAGGQG